MKYFGEMMIQMMAPQDVAQKVKERKRKSRMNRVRFLSEVEEQA